jgi:predicted extracellular nuclease
MQDPTPDTGANPNSTSEAIFVFLGNSAIANPTVGQSVQVTGRVDEFRPANNATNLTTTQIDATVSGAAVGAIASLGTVTPTIIGTGGRTQPTTSFKMISLLPAM